MAVRDTQLTSTRLILAVMILGAVVFGWTGLKFQIANMLAESTNPLSPEAKLVAEYAVWFSSTDPIVRWFLASSSRDLSSQERVALYEETVRLAPGDFRWWLELARAREEADEILTAEQAFEKAVSLAPAYVYPRWRSGNFYLRQGKTEKALQEFQILLQHNTKYRQQVFSVLWDYFDQDPKILEEIASKSPSSLVDLALFFAARNLPEESLAIWRKLDEKEKKEREQTAKVIAQGLFDKKFFRTAVEFSKEIGIDINAEREKISNGSFELSVSRESTAYFDWKVIPVEKTDVRLDPTRKKDGNRSLRIQFNGYAGVQFYHFYQTVAVEPSTRYALSFWYRAEKIKSAGPPIVEVISANDSKFIKASQPLTNTDEWKQGEIIFTTPENTEGITVRIARVICGEQCPLFGIIWLDDFQLKRL